MFAALRTRTIAAATFALGSTLLTWCPARAALHAGDAVPAFSVPGTKPGTTIDLHASRGRPVYLNLFASWCAPCNAEAPTVRRLAAKYRKLGLVTFGIDVGEDAATATRFAKNYAWPFALGFDEAESVPSILQTPGLPVHLFVDRRGKVSTLRFGEMDPDDIEAAIRKILR